MIEVLIVSIGLVLVIEGLLYFVIADKLDLLVTFLKNYDNQKIKFLQMHIV